MLYLRLFLEFFKIGLFAVGGGMATLPFLYDLSDSTGWFTRAQLTDMIAVAESTPGPIGVNTATYVGFTTCGVGG
ncbi:MAG: chromate transporter, partial [Oscillospiraceae bacterium]|nr:chromate transporter [Oscillospiraceae bacterium]